MSPEELSCFVRAHTFLSFPSARALLNGHEHDVVFANDGFAVPSRKTENMAANGLHCFLASNEFGYSETMRTTNKVR